MLYKTILADPPWSYRNKNTGGSMTSGSATKYPTMTIAEIGALDVASIAARDAVLFLWATVPLLPEVMPVLAMWGFTYKTALFWVKTGRNGMGFWFRGGVEMCLVGARRGTKALRSQQSNVIYAPVRAHSQKPEEFYNLVEPVTKGPRVELFARAVRPGWRSIGLETNGERLSVEDFIREETQRCANMTNRKHKTKMPSVRDADGM